MGFVRSINKYADNRHHGNWLSQKRKRIKGTSNKFITMLEGYGLQMVNRPGYLLLMPRYANA